MLPENGLAGPPYSQEPGESPPVLTAPPAFLQDSGILLALSALALFGVFLSNLLGILLGARLLDPAWQMRLSELLIGSAPFALLGSCLMLVAAFLDAEQPLIEFWWLKTRQLAWIACLGYLLLVPLQASALIRLGILMEQPAQQRIDALRSIRDAIGRGQNRAAINLALRSLPGSPQIPSDFRGPLDDFRRDAGSRINERLGELAREKQVATRFRRVGDALVFLRLGGISAILSAAFSAFAMRRAERGSWLEQLVLMWSAQADRRLQRRLARQSGSDRKRYLDALKQSQELDDRDLEEGERGPHR